jgi:hypothetical protein
MSKVLAHSVETHWLDDLDGLALESLCHTKLRVYQVLSVVVEAFWAIHICQTNRTRP